MRVKKITLSELELVIKKVISEAKDNMDQVYFDSYSGAVGYAKESAEKRGYEIDDDEWFNQISTGPGRPKEGKTTRSTIELIKNGKPQKKCLHIQVYNRGNNVTKNYELNFYIN